jgi:HAD superfamily hydrolase (TIGR01509 family)
LLKALIFDFDGLILDTETPEMQVWQELFARHGQAFSVETWGQIVGGAGHTTFEPAAYLEGLVGQPIDRQAMNLQARQLSDEAILRQPVLPGAVELICTAKNQGYPLAIASSSPHAWVDNHLKRLGLFEYFDAILCAEDVTRTKPDPGLYLAALKALQVQAGQAIVFEDSPNGIQAAKTAGIFTVAVPNPLTVQLSLGQPDLILSSLEEVSLEDLRSRMQ